MDLEKAYNKIDNLCCVNHTIVALTNQVIDSGSVPSRIDFFEGYNETQDDDFCKDPKEMVEALETIKEIVDLQKEIGCSLSVLSKALKQDYIYTNSGKHSRLEFGTYGGVWCICYGLRTQIRVDGYKNIWWLKEDKSE